MKSKKIVKTEISFAGGFFSCDKSKNQIPHILEHMILAKISPDSSFRKNGKTNNFYTSFSIESIYDDHGDNLRKFILAILSPDLSNDEFCRQKEIIKNELLMHKNNKSREIFDEIILSQNEDFPTLDEQIESLENITLTDVENYYNNFFIAENMSFLTSGDRTIEDQIHEIISSVNFRHGEKFKFAKSFNLKSDFAIKKFEKLSKCMLIFVLDFLPGSKEKACLELLSFVLRERLYKEFRHKSFAYRFYGYLSEGLFFGKSILILEGDFLREDEQDFLNTVNNEIQKISNFSEKDFAKTKDDFRKFLIFNSQTAEQNNSHLRIRRFIYGESSDWREFIEEISFEDFINLTKKIKDIKIK